VLVTAVDPHAPVRERHVADVSAPRLAGVFTAYLSLTKPRIIELLLMTTVPVMFLAAGGVPDLWLVAATVVGGTLAAASANVLNCVLDRDIDERMRRTRRRPLPSHQVSARAALIFGVVLGVAATAWLGMFVNWLSAGLALAANAFYVVGYTMLLKRRTSQNIVWGGAAGCFPALIGWTAVRDDLAWAPVVLFMVVFFWTPPHFWSLAIRYRDDYAAAEVPMLPVVCTAASVARRILAYSYLTVGVSMLLWPVASTGWVYPLGALLLGVVFVAESHLLLRRCTTGDRVAEIQPMRLFHASNLYLALLFLCVALDPLVMH
jgi:protoheme IX farnesyltransferase